MVGLLIILAIVVILIILLYLFSNVILSTVFGKRCEGNPNLKYFTVDDFEELENKQIEFKSDKGQMLRGFIYKNKLVKEKDVKGLLIFVHGMGAGHFSYTTEINTLTKNGYKVLAYDNTGTCMSEGKCLNGFYQAVLDLKSCLEYVKTNEDLNKYNIGLIGHSWGAYSVVQVLKYRPNVKAVVALCGPDTFENIITSSMKSFGNVLKPFIRFIIKNKFGKDGIQKSSDVLQNISENVSVLLIHGEADKICTYENSIVYNKDKFEKNENIMTVSYEGKEHNLYQTIESEKYLNEVFGKIEEYKKSFKGKELEEKLNKHYSSIDYNKITEEDDEVLETIVEFFNNTVK